jgi:hypothetical protein
MNGRKPPISSIYTRNSSVSSYRPSSGVSSISIQTSNTQPPPQVRVPTRTAPLAPPAPPAITRNGVLFVIIDGNPSKQLKSNVQVALSKGRTIAELLILGEQKHEQALKQFKVEMYGLAGSLKRELGVRVEFLEGALNEEQLGTVQRSRAATRIGKSCMAFCVTLERRRKSLRISWTSIPLP